MRRRGQKSLWLRGVSACLVVTQVGLGVPAAAQEAENKSSAVQAPAAIDVQKQAPKVEPPPAYPRFSAAPTDEEILRARVFDEPLIPMGATLSIDENRALASAITAYLNRGNPEDTRDLDAFLKAHPDSRWRVGLLTNLGIVYRRTGFFSRALEVWQEAWDLGKAESEPNAKTIVDRALGELAELNARLGRYDFLEALFKEIEGRPIKGSATEKLTGAREGLWQMNNTPEEAFLCGPLGVERILAFGKPDYRRPEPIKSAQSTRRGTSLPQMRDLAASVGLAMQMAKREGDVDPLVPALVHWKAGHFAALVKEEEGRYLIQDPTFGNELWLSRVALNAETTGYFLVPTGPLPKGWRSVGEQEGQEVWGKGATAFSDAECTSCSCNKAGSGNQSSNSGSSSPGNQSSGPGGSSSGGCGGPACAMAVYDMHLMLVSLNIVDTPVGYSPPRGPSVHFTATYNQREAFQPQVFSYSNLGNKWTFDWLSYVEDDPANLTQPAYVYLRGGGRETYTGFNPATQSYPYHRKSRATVVRISSSPITYERRLADGSVEVFSQADGAMTFPRRVFMTAWKDTQGNTASLTYDASLRIVAVTDAIGQVTTLSYQHPSDALKITKVTDPFGRFATLQYDTSGQLASITDVIGMTSAFQSTTGTDFIEALTTPYGTSRFVMGENGRDRWLEATDPLGATERVEYVNNLGVGWNPYGVEPIPTGFASQQGFPRYVRNSFYWNKRAWSLYPGQYVKAHMFHWLKDISNTTTVDIVENEKRPLENRVWYLYPGQDEQIQGWINRPSTVARVLDDGTTQTYLYEYESQTGRKTRETDPLGRTTTYTYAANGIDLLEARQVNGQSTERLWSATYNSQHKPLTMTDAAGQTTTFAYNTQGQVLTVETPPRGGLTQAQRTTTYSYDTNGYLQSVTGPATGATTSYTYDGYGRVRTATDSDSYTLTYDFDALDRPTTTTYPDGTYEETVYKRLDPEKRRDRVGRWSETFYDALRRPVAIRDPLGRTTTQQWCNCGSLDKVFDANNNATTWERDLQGRVTREIRPDNSSWEYTYENTTSRLKQRKDPKNQLAGYEYFLDNNPKRVTYTNAVVATPTVSYTYDSVYSRPTAMMDGTGTTGYTYVPITTSPPLGAGELASVDGPLANDTVSYTYDELGRLASRGLSGFVSSFSYDSLGRLTTQGGPVGSFTYSYDGTTFRPLSLSYPNGQATQYTYFPNSGDRRLQQLKHLAPGAAMISQYDYTYTLTGNLATWSQQVGAGTAKLYTFGYDATDQLTTAQISGPTPLPVPNRFAYGYDKGGNRTAEQIDDAVMGASFNTRNQLMSRQPGGALLFRGTVSEAATVSVGGQPAQVDAGNTFQGTAPVPSGTSTVAVVATDPSGNFRTNTYQVSESGATTGYIYDANGNVTGDGTRTFEWDAENRLTAVKQGAATLASFAYSGDGRRAQKTAGGVTTSYVYDGDGVIEERLSTGGTLDYVRGPRVDQHWALRDGGGVVTYFLTDHLGSVVQTTNASGAVTLSRDYDPYGNPLSGPSQSGYAFTGREWDAETGLLYMRSRYYDPTLGRFLSEDPIGLDNPYAYVTNRPTIGTDPYGLIDPWTLCFRFGICPPPSGPSATVVPPPPKPRPTPTPINCSGGPNAGMSANPFPMPTPTPTPQCIGEGLCPCGYVAVPDPSSAGLCWVTLGNVPTVGTAANGRSTPQTGMAGAARTGLSTGRPNAVPTNPNAPRNPGPAAGGGMAGLMASLPFCANVGIKCVPK